MTDREHQRQLDLLAMQFVDALEASDFETIDRLWAISATEPELEAVFLECAAELALIYDAEVRAPVNGKTKGKTKGTRTVWKNKGGADRFP
jgi:hypothetical protein